jgi:hypothetical protein
MSKTDKVDEFFAMKCYMKYRPYTSVFAIMIATILVCGIWFKIFEAPYPDTEFDNLSDSWWLIVVSITTIGYGEMVPHTHLGRG